MRRATAWLGLAAVALGAAGCIDDLPSGVRIERPRVLAVRVRIDGEPQRAQPRPGETITLRWLTAPEGGAWTGALTACVAAPGNTGLPRCMGEPFAIAPPGPPSARPTFTLTMPEDAAGEVLIGGVLCEGGTPALPEDGLPTCEGESATTELVTFDLSLATDQPPNRHPSWDDETFMLDGVTWTAPDDPPATGCAEAAGGAALPRVPRRGEEEPSAVRFSSSPDDREAFEELVYGDPPSIEEMREELLVSHVATAGLFSRLSTEVFDDDAPAPEVSWRHPDAEDVPDDGLTVRFWFVVRDGRGGMDWVERAACVVP
ncbi:MAG TPA: hypothetical protein RMH99_32900 [Sandaracinaceae bacterium LLY-WYZ-13_1]|nr:hypothetical protein [Sandaracinaceae bacterium LLY-WYZ-13_1]